MANIAADLQAIMDARYGREVRLSIHDAIYDINEDAEHAVLVAETAQDSALNNAILAESYAKGGTGTRAGEDTDNSKYYKEQAEEYVSDAQGYAQEASGYVQDASDKVTDAESYAKGGTGTRAGEDTDNSKYYKEQAEEVLTNVISYVQTVVFSVNFTTGNLTYEGDTYTFSIDATTGQLQWEVA